MAKSKKNKIDAPGILVKCESGRYIAYYDHRTDIIANGDNEKEAKKNLKVMYEIVTKHEEEAEEEKKTLHLPNSYITKKFKDKVSAS